MALLILASDVLTAYGVYVGEQIQPATLWKILIINLMLLTGIVIYGCARYYSGYDKATRTFFRFPEQPETFTFNTISEFIGMLLISMSLASLIKLWTPRVYQLLGMIPAGIFSFLIYLVACLFMAIALCRLMFTLSRYSQYIYWPATIIACTVAYYIFGAGYDLVQ